MGTRGYGLECRGGIFWRATTIALAFGCVSTSALGYDTDFDAPPLLIGPGYPQVFRCVLVNITDTQTVPKRATAAGPQLRLVVDKDVELPSLGTFTCNGTACAPSCLPYRQNYTPPPGAPTPANNACAFTCPRLGPRQSCAIELTLNTPLPTPTPTQTGAPTPASTPTPQVPIPIICQPYKPPNRGFLRASLMSLDAQHNVQSVTSTFKED